MSDRKNIVSGAPWESIVGYCRAVRVGPHIVVSGTAPVGKGGAVVGEGDAYIQARRCIEIIAKALGEAGAGLKQVVRTRMYVTDIEQWPDVARAHQEAFGMIMPATTMVEVNKLIDPAMLVEIEADAYLQDTEDGC
ncbi:MAG: RidA family protein [Woeseiaceae bacterium]